MKHLLLLSLLLLPACTSAQSRSFQITIKNETARPLSLGLVKNGPPAEDGWIAPHEVAMMAPQLSDRKWGWVLNPGETKTFGPHTGHFESQTQAILRIFAGTPTIDEILSFSREDPERLDIYLFPGKSAYVIRYAPGGRLEHRLLDSPP